MKVKPSPKPGRVVVEVGAAEESLLARSGAGAASSPLQLRKILVPVDFSDCSKKALEYAVPFARQFNAGLTLLHVVQVNYPAGEFGPVEPPIPETQLAETSQAELEALAGRQVGGQVPTTLLVRVGRPDEEIVLAARELNIDLIIISTHGHTGLKHVLLGSTTEHVVRRAPCPVLTVREHEHDFVTPSQGAG